MTDASVQKVVIDSPIGHLAIKGSVLGLRSINKTEETLTGSALEHSLPACVIEAVEQLNEYFDHRRKVFRLQFDWSGHPDFSVQVWKILQTIPYGETTTYSAVASLLGQPSAVRAVGMANRNNPFSIVVPCHRVIGKSGHLTGYLYGLDTKLQLLRHENRGKYPVQLSLIE